MPDVKLDFDAIYVNNGFNSKESKSGEGSTMAQTRIIREEIPKLLRELEVKHMLDVPCGDWNWMQHVDLTGIYYTGGDVVQAIVDANIARFANENREFHRMDILKGPLHQSDLVLCRDCLVHLSYADGLAAINQFRSSCATWLLATTFPKHHNSELSGVWRALNLEEPPYSLPRASRYIVEGCTEGGGAYADKSLGLWRLRAW